ncbi:CC/Se motif family (seleno)protein [Bacillus sp. S/N-304-OC-R1]|uniref:CC/Se motif family (seleno)protein n=1 Tax=Bacillus sp. S/N-304-OC-R1 TaxID=2758034 RepID=UPI001C8D96BC|nr:CC/Se motif family (seleno)protein [Bacillus sp. S/N-304-OC-R1]MBY0121815.1 Fe-S oxidoreductase [Bacillus sp. S/N-304-OC-R1]
MIIEVDEESKKWIESKGNQLTVKTLDVKGCCAPGVQEIVAVPGKPKTLNYFHEVSVDNLTIYVQRDIKFKEKLVLKLSGFSLLKTMSVKLY